MMLRIFTWALVSCCLCPALSQAAADADADHTVILKAGQLLVLRNLYVVTSETAKVGDPMRFELIKPVKAGELQVIPAGAIANGKVALVEKKRAKGHGGKLGISIEEIQTVTGETIKLRAYEEKQAGSNRSDEIGGLIIAGPLPGAGAMLIPLALLLPGNDMVIEKGTRFTAATDSSTALDFDALTTAQPAPSTPPPDVATLYLYRKGEGLGPSEDTWPAAMGEQLLGLLGPGRFILLRLPPGAYWLHNRQAEDSGLVRIDKEKPEQLFELRAEGGKTYYIRQNLQRVAGSGKRLSYHMEFVDEAAGSEEITELFAPAGQAIDPDAALRPNTIESSNAAPLMATKCYMVANQFLASMQAQPGAAEKKKRLAAVSARQQVACQPDGANPATVALLEGSVLRDGTPIPLIVRTAISSATAQAGDTVEFATTAEIAAGGVVAIPKGSIAIGVVTQAQPKRRMGRAGKLNLDIEYVQLSNGGRVPLRAAPQVSGKSHAKAVTGAVAGTGLVFFPAAPLMLLRHGADITMPEGTEITVFINGDVSLDQSRIKLSESAPNAASPAAETEP